MEREAGADLWGKPPQLRAACIFNTVLLNLVCLMWSSWFYGDHKRVARFKKIIIKSLNGGFPGGPMVKSLCFCCKGQGFDPFLRDWDTIYCEAKKKKKEREISNLNIQKS